MTVALVDPATQQPVLNADVQIVATPGEGKQPVSAPGYPSERGHQDLLRGRSRADRRPMGQISVVHSDASGNGSAGFTLDVQPAARNWRPIAIGAVLAVIAVGAWFILRKQ